MRFRVLRSGWQIWAGLAVACGIAGLGALATTDRRPLPAPSRVLAEMRASWKRRRPYEARVGVRIPQSVVPREAFIRCEVDGTLLFSEVNPAGFRSVQRLRGAAGHPLAGPTCWEWFQYGLETLYQVRIDDPRRTSHAAWRITGFPTPGDVVEVLSATPGLRVRERRSASGYPSGGDGSSLVVECPPPEPPRGAPTIGGSRNSGAPQAGPPQPGSGSTPEARFDLQRDALGGAWEIVVLERTMLPVSLSAVRSGASRPYLVRWQPLGPRDYTRSPHWIETAPGGLPPSPAGGGEPRVRRTVRLELNRAEPEAVDAVRGRIESEVAAWQRGLYQQFAGPASERPASGYPAGTSRP